MTSEYSANESVMMPSPATASLIIEKARLSGLSSGTHLSSTTIDLIYRAFVTASMIANKESRVDAQNMISMPGPVDAESLAENAQLIAFAHGVSLGTTELIRVYRRLLIAQHTAVAREQYARAQIKQRTSNHGIVTRSSGHSLLDRIKMPTLPKEHGLDDIYDSLSDFVKVEIDRNDAPQILESIYAAFIIAQAERDEVDHLREPFIEMPIRARGGSLLRETMAVFAESKFASEVSVMTLIRVWETYTAIEMQNNGLNPEDILGEEKLIPMTMDLNNCYTLHTAWGMNDGYRIEVGPMHEVYKAVVKSHLKFTPEAAISETELLMPRSFLNDTLLFDEVMHECEGIAPRHAIVEAYEVIMVARLLQDKE